jgi:DNA-3-methyladenine glycosylase I
MEKYHDVEWGVPLFDDKKIFEFLVLDGFQAGLSWKIILDRRDFFRDSFYGFDPFIVANLSKSYIDELLINPKIIRNRQKINATIENAKAFIKVINEFGSFSNFIWGFVDGKPIHNQWNHWDEIPSSTPISMKVSKELISRKFQFVGPVICYAFLQSIGIINDHTLNCFRYSEIINLQK